jgi:hypothetical protein
MAFVNGFDADKAQAYNELRQSSPNLSQAQLFSQAGISAAEQGYYQASPIGFLIQNPTPTNVNTTLFAPSGTNITAANFLTPSPQQPVNEFERPLNLSGGDLNAQPSIVSSSANINPNVEPVPEEFVATSVPEGFEGGAGFDFNNAAAIVKTQSQGAQKDQAQWLAQQDWRFRISLAPNANYLYKDPDISATSNHILSPLIATSGVVFPYTPNIQVSYSATYEPTDLAHTNYRIYQYRNSNVGDITISCDFTAQDTNEANYLLAVIHFFKSVTKMFYGNDTQPQRGTPPPLCYLNGFGKYQFNNHPVAITNFSYNLPNEVDYIKAGVVANTGGLNLQTQTDTAKTTNSGSFINDLLSSFFRLKNNGLTPGAKSQRPTFNLSSVSDPTYVPTKIQIQISCIPIISRYAMANNFSLKEYSKGSLLLGNQNGTGGIW